MTSVPVCVVRVTDEPVSCVPVADVPVCVVPVTVVLVSVVPVIAVCLSETPRGAGFFRLPRRELDDLFEGRFVGVLETSDSGSSITSIRSDGGDSVWALRELEARALIFFEGFREGARMVDALREPSLLAYTRIPSSGRVDWDP